VATMNVLNPVATSVGDLRRYPLAARGSGLEGKTIGLWWNLKRGGEVALRRVGSRLQERFPGVDLVWLEDQFPASVDTVNHATKDCQAVVGATGD
jgi:hypothetical protein